MNAITTIAADPKAALASASALHSEKVPAHREAQAAHHVARAVSQELLDKAASGETVTPADMGKADDAAIMASRLEAIAGAVAASALRNRDAAELAVLFDDASGLRRAFDDAVDRRIGAGAALDDAMAVARAALVRHADAGFDVMQAYGAAQSFDFSTIPAMAASNAALAALDAGERPRVGAPAHQMSPPLVVELARKMGAS